jgi:hypothetical protein
MTLPQDVGALDRYAGLSKVVAAIAPVQRDLEYPCKTGAIASLQLLGTTIRLAENRVAYS